MTEEELRAIEARANAATKGPWILTPTEFYDDFTPNVVITADDSGPCISESYSDRADSEFIAHARTDVPALIAEVCRLQEKLERQAEHHLKARQEHGELYDNLYQELCMAWFWDVLGFVGALEAAKVLQRKMENSWAELFTKYLALGGLKDVE